MTYRKPLIALLTGLAASSVATVSMAAQALQASTNVSSGVTVSAPSSSQSANGFDKWGSTGALTQLDANATATVVLDPRQDTGSASVFATAGWNDANQGALVLDKNVAVQTDALVTTRFNTPDGPEFTYVFTATADGALSVETRLSTPTPDMHGLGAFDAGLFDDPTGALAFDASDSSRLKHLSTSVDAADPFVGTTTFDLQAGKTYAFAIFDREDNVTQGVGRSDGHGQLWQERASFNWEINDATGGGGAVPEPASWALMIGGFGLAGAALRRRAVGRAA